MTKDLLNLMTALACALGGTAASRSALAATAPDDWQQLTAVGAGSQSRLAFSHWPNDKYPQLPDLVRARVGPRQPPSVSDLDTQVSSQVVQLHDFPGWVEVQIILAVDCHAPDWGGLGMPQP